MVLNSFRRPVSFLVAASIVIQASFPAFAASGPFASDRGRSAAPAPDSPFASSEQNPSPEAAEFARMEALVNGAGSEPPPPGTGRDPFRLAPQTVEIRGADGRFKSYSLSSLNLELPPIAISDFDAEVRAEADWATGDLLLSRSRRVLT
jgi:hypothetical protein